MLLVVLKIKYRFILERMEFLWYVKVVNKNCLKAEEGKSREKSDGSGVDWRSKGNR